MDASDLLASVGRNERVWTLGLLALVHLRRSRSEEALAFARQVMRALIDWRALSFYAQHGVFGAAEVFLDRLESQNNMTWSLQFETRLMMRRVARFGLRHPLTLTRTLLLLGRYAALRGRRTKAVQLMQRALSEAVRQQRPVEQGAARAGLERLGVGGAP
jgi:hypothetical protein